MVESLLVSLPFLGVINFVFISLTMYATIRPALESVTPWLRLWMFMLGLVGVVFVAMFLIWKFVLSPLWKFRGEQMLEDKISRELKEIKGMLEEINERRGR